MYDWHLITSELSIDPVPAEMTQSMYGKDKETARKVPEGLEIK